MISAEDIGWVAGFLEGEGCFNWAQRRLSVNTTQKDWEPLVRLQEVVGGTLRQYKNRKQMLWRHVVTGPQAAGLMMTVYTLMSARRRDQIKTALQGWQSVPAWSEKRRGVCTPS